LDYRNITTKDAYADFVVRAQEIAIKHGYVPVNWYFFLFFFFTAANYLGLVIAGNMNQLGSLFASLRSFWHIYVNVVPCLEV